MRIEKKTNSGQSVVTPWPVCRFSTAVAFSVGAIPAELPPEVPGPDLGPGPVRDPERPHGGRSDTLPVLVYEDGDECNLVGPTPEYLPDRDPHWRPERRDGPRLVVEATSPDLVDFRRIAGRIDYRNFCI